MYLYYTNQFGEIFRKRTAGSVPERYVGDVVQWQKDATIRDENLTNINETEFYRIKRELDDHI